MKWLKMYIVEGEELPKGYGIAYWDYSCYRGVCYPIPLNWIVWTIRETWIRLIKTPESLMESIGKQQYADGWIHGYHQGEGMGYEKGYKKCLEDLEDSVRKKRDA